MEIDEFVAGLKCDYKRICNDNYLLLKEVEVKYHLIEDTDSSHQMIRFMVDAIFQLFNFMSDLGHHYRISKPLFPFQEHNEGETTLFQNLLGVVDYKIKYFEERIDRMEDLEGKIVSLEESKGAGAAKRRDALCYILQEECNFIVSELKRTYGQFYVLLKATGTTQQHTHPSYTSRLYG